MSIKQYGVRPASFFEDPEGMWVQHDDHMAEVERLTDEITAQQRQNDALAADLAAARAQVDLMAEALAEIKATVDGDSAQPVRDIIYGYLAERAALAALPTAPAEGAREPRVVGNIAYYTDCYTFGPGSPLPAPPKEADDA